MYKNKFLIISFIFCVLIAPNTLFGSSNDLYKADPSKKLIGTWSSGHEPYSYDFNADGTYKFYSPKGSLEPDAPEEVYASGTWKIVQGKLHLKATKGKNDSDSPIQISWINDNQIYFGSIKDIPDYEIEEYSWYRHMG